MNSDLLNSFGLGYIDIAYFLIGFAAAILLLLIILIVQICRFNKLKKKYMKFMQGKAAKSLEKDIIGLYEDNKFLKQSTESNKKEIRMLYKKFEGAYQKCGIIKYDAFQQMGGQLSYSLALLNERNDGFILNSVHSTDGCYSYTKEIKNGQSSITLGEEEKQALDMAIGIDE